MNGELVHLTDYSTVNKNGYVEIKVKFKIWNSRRAWKNYQNLISRVGQGDLK